MLISLSTTNFHGLFSRYSQPISRLILTHQHFPPLTRHPSALSAWRYQRIPLRFTYHQWSGAMITRESQCVLCQQNIRAMSNTSHPYCSTKCRRRWNSLQQLIKYDEGITKECLQLGNIQGMKRLDEYIRFLDTNLPWRLINIDQQLQQLIKRIYEGDTWTSNAAQT